MRARTDRPFGINLFTSPQPGPIDPGAFKEAFLQQAENQLETVGNAADSTLGSFMRLESQLKNTSDAFKMDAASWAEPFIDALADSFKESAHFKDVLSTINEELYNQYIATGRITPEMRNVVAEYDRAKEYGETWGKLLEGEVNPATEDATEDTKALAAAQKQAADAVKKATDANKSYVSNKGTLLELTDVETQDQIEAWSFVTSDLVARSARTLAAPSLCAFFSASAASGGM